MPSGWAARVRAALWVLLALLVGVATHLLWDAFTHADGWIVDVLPAMREAVGPFSVYRWLQYLSSIAGLMVVAIWAARWAGRTPRGIDPARREVTVLQRTAAWIMVAGSLVIIALAVWIAGLANGAEPLDRVLVYRTSVVSISCSSFFAVLAGIGWYLLPKRVVPAG
jgi:hypothetical protein